MPDFENLLSDFELSPDAIGVFVDSCDGKVISFEGNERRNHVRYVVALPTVVQPLDEKLSPSGDSFHAVTRDISVGGVSLVHTYPIQSKYISVEIKPREGAAIRLLVKVLRCKPLGSYYDVAGEFVTGKRSRSEHVDDSMYLYVQSG